MTAPSLLGMSPARRRIFETGSLAQAERDAAEAQRREAAMERRRQAQREALEAALVRQEAEAQAAARAAARRHPVTRIITEVAEKHGLAPAEITGPSKPANTVLARHEAMWRARQETNLSLPAIGRRFGGRDHTTVLHGVRKHQARVDGGPR